MTKKKSIPVVEAVKHPYYMTYTGIYDCSKLIYAESEVEAIAMVMNMADEDLNWHSISKPHPKSITVKCINDVAPSIIDTVENFYFDWKSHYNISDIKDDLTGLINTISTLHPEPSSKRKKILRGALNTQKMCTEYADSKEPYYMEWKGKYSISQIIHAESEAQATEMVLKHEDLNVEIMDLGRPQPKSIKVRLVDKTMLRIVGQVNLDVQTWKSEYDFDIDWIRNDLTRVLGYIDEHYDDLRASTKLHKAVDSGQ